MTVYTCSILYFIKHVYIILLNLAMQQDIYYYGIILQTQRLGEIKELVKFLSSRWQRQN